MSPQIDFYLDFVSPYGYLANVKLPGIARKWGARLKYRPVDVADAKVAAGNTGPSTRAIPAKRKYIRADRLRWAKRYGVPMNDPKAFRAPRLNSGVIYAERAGVVERYVNAAYHQVWGVGVDPEDEAILALVARELGWDPRAFLAYVDSDEGRNNYAASQREAEERGVFGVPFMVVGEETFWGNDRFDYLEECLARAPGAKAPQGAGKAGS
jgi:2-hydroxychromene-2-carboxylate isomerase